MNGIRIAGCSDKESIYTLYEAAKAKGRRDGSSDWDEYYPNEAILDDDLQRSIVFVMEENGAIVASLSLIEYRFEEEQTIPWTEDNACFLTRLCVQPEKQGMGIGEIMMRHAGEYARSNGYKATHHLAAVANNAANRLYKRMGYISIGEVTRYETRFIAYEMIL